MTKHQNNSKQGEIPTTSEVLQIIDERGKVPHGLEPNLSDEDLLEIYRYMILTRTADAAGLTLQRQGRIGPYVPCIGHEAAHVGSAYALEPSDWIFPHYRSQGAAFTRGMPLKVFFAELFGRTTDLAKGHQMPNSLGDRSINYVSLSAPVGAMLPHAVGVALAAKYRKDKLVTLAYFGEGATSSNEFHTALNFAGVFKAPTVFFCHNNQYAISVPLSKQTAAASIAAKAVAYGFEGVRVDGNDVIAVYRVTKEAVEKARSKNLPTLIEALTYRVGPHSSVDDPSRYRSEEEVTEWHRKDPVDRFKLYLENKNVLGKEQDEKLRTEIERDVDLAVKETEAIPPPELHTLVEDVYAEIPSHLAEEFTKLMMIIGKKE